MDSPHSAPLLERLTWLPYGLKELNLCLDRKSVGVGAIFDMLGRFGELERLGVRFENEVATEGENWVEDVAVSAIFSGCICAHE